jgi:hypothetical protein
MNPLPADPLARHGRFIAAWCDDLASRDLLRTGRTPRADAILAVSRPRNEARGDSATAGAIRRA